MQRKSKDKLLVLAGRPIGTVDIVRYAQSKGVYVIVCDFLPVEKSPAKKIADEVWNYSTSKVDLISERASNCGVTAVFTGAHEFNITKTIEVCERLNLPFYCTMQQWKICQNKIKFKDLCLKFNVLTPKNFKTAKNQDIKNPNEIDFPVIVKPSDSSASRGISICHNLNDLSLGIDAALKKSVEKRVVVEKFLKGDELMIFYTIQNGVSYLTGICKRYTNNSYGGFTPLPEFYYFDKRYIHIYETKINKNIQKMFDSIGLKNCVVLLQAFFCDNNFYIFEMSLRLNASQEYNLTSSLLGFNPLEMLVDYSLTREFGSFSIQNHVDPYWDGKHVCILPIVLKVGRIKTINGIDRVKEKNDVVSVNMFGGNNEEITEEMFGSMNQVWLRFYIASDSKEEMIETVAFVNKTLEVVDEFDNDMTLFKFNTDLI